MFKFLKEKLKKIISKTSDKIEKEGEIITAAEEKGFFSKFKEKFAKKEKIEDIEIGEKEYKEVIKEVEVAEQEKEAIEEEKKIVKEDIKKEPKKVEQEKKLAETEEKGFFGKIKERLITKKINSKQFEEMFNDLELILLENNVAVEVVDKIKSDLENELVEKPIKRNKIEETIRQSLKNSITGLFDIEEIDLLNLIKKNAEKPFVMAFFGINGSGKTTTIAKIAELLKQNKISCVLAASDTFRAASIEQLQKHADNLKVKLIKHDYGADPAAVAFDAIKHSKAKGIDAVLIDTAGRMHSNQNLIDELKKITRVAKPDLKIFVGEAITGNDCVEQAKTFNEAVGIDGIILAKADIDEKGGAAISVSYVTKKPILFLGTGQKYNDLEAFDSEIVVKNLGLV